MMHLFPEGTDLSAPALFTNPFRYVPHHLVRLAADMAVSYIDASPALSEAFSEGKMLGVLIVRDKEGRLGYLQGFSGNIAGQGTIEGFVPPIYDLTQPGGFYRIHEAEISEITSQIRLMEESGLIPAERALDRLREECEKEVLERRSELKRSKHLRTVIRESWDADGRRYMDESSRLALKSQHEKAEFKRFKDGWKIRIKEAEDKVSELKEKHAALKAQRAAMSEELQRWIFDQYIVHDAAGRQASILEVFQAKGLVPPGGTGECAAPKLLDHAFRHGLTPVAMGEFWYGRSPETAVRTHGHFYPSCTSKCGLLLEFMLNGLPISGEDSTDEPEIIHEDEAIIVAGKPAGMPSVPGLDGRHSLQEWLQSRISSAQSDHETCRQKVSGGKLFPVHRLDMDTSGIIIFAKTHDAEVHLKKQFEEHTIKKTYIARLCPPDSRHILSEQGTEELYPGSTGTIELPLSPDYDERPRQKVDKIQGKPSLTEYQVSNINKDGTADIIYRPLTGRTHQLRVHSAHTLGLRRPILGDLLYGGACSPASQNHCPDGGSSRLHLHALSITFIHPASGEPVTLTSGSNCYPLGSTSGEYR